MKIHSYRRRWFPWGIALFFILSNNYVAYGQGYELKTGREVALLSAGAAGTATSILLRERRQPFSLKEVDEFDINDIFALDRLSKGDYRERAKTTSDILVGASFALPLTFLAFDNTRADLSTLGLILLETITINEALTGITKALVKRPRPYTYNREAPETVRTMRGNNFSFFSGHTSYAAALSFFTAKTISDYVDNSGTRTLAWTGAFILPAATGYLRYRAGKHFPTDVITGYIVGASLGYLLPQLHKADNPSESSQSTAGQMPVIQPLFQITFVL